MAALQKQSEIRLLVFGVVLLTFIAGTASTRVAQATEARQQVIAPIILDVPFISQMEQDCGGCTGMNNCGPASLAMVLQAYACVPVAASPTELVHTMRWLMTGTGNKCGQDVTSFSQMRLAIGKLPDSVPSECRQLISPTLQLRSDHIAEDVQSILNRVKDGVPVIVAVRGPLLLPTQTTTTAFNSGPNHLLVVTGFDDERVYVNDPLYRRATAPCTPTEGSWYYTRESWEKAVAARGEGAVAIGPGLASPLEVVQSLTLAKSIRPGEAVTAYFKLRNRGSETITLARLGVASRGPQTSINRDNMVGARLWNADNTDFAFVENVRLAPGQEYEYRQSRSFVKEGSYFATLSYVDASGFVHTLTGPAEFMVGGSVSSQDDAVLIGRAPVLVAMAQAKVAVSLQVQNTGSADWPVGQGYALQNVNNQPLGSAGQIELAADIPTDAVANWVLPLQAPATPGLYRSEWQMVHGNQAFGPQIGIEMRVVGVNPAGWFERLRQEVERRLAELRATLQREIEEALRRELERQLRGICGGALVGPGLMLCVGWWLSDRRKGSHAT